MTKVFIVDDENIAIRRLESLLKDFTSFLIIGKSNNAEEAVKEIVRNKPDLIFLDIELGDLTGFDVLDSIRKLGIMAKVIFVTAHNHYAIKALREKALDYLLKPVDLSELKNAINNFLSSDIEETIKIKINKFSFLTNQEKSVLAQLAQGKTSKQTGGQMGLSALTIDTYRRNILKKFEANNLIDLLNKINSSS